MSPSRVRKSCFVSRGSTAFGIFWRGVPPVGTDTGESRVSGRIMGWSGVFVIVQVSVKMLRGQIARLDLRSGLIPGDFLDGFLPKQLFCIVRINPLSGFLGW